MAESSFFSRAYDVVRQIPEGKVASYGQVARLMGEPRRARYVGYAMHASPGMEGGVPCHRVVFKDGRLAGGYAFGGPGVQRSLLEGEGVGFLADGRVDMARFCWEALTD
ncbi:MAG: MGMT family protein [Coriobacteriia bacterium]|nr:MGMT family protein [Coriobacteriia bacterium]